jgi:predicted  nucleic acid-binding Zn-ribbon protein
VLTILGDLDLHLRDQEGEWKSVVAKLSAARRELAMATAQLQTTRSLAVREPHLKDEDSVTRERATLAYGREERHARLLRQFEAALREAEARRGALHEETERLKNRRQAALLHLSAPVRVAYEAASRAGRVPAVTPAVDGLCRVCRARLPSEVVEAVVHGAVVSCPGCERLLCPTEAT